MILGISLLFFGWLPKVLGNSASLSTSNTMISNGTQLARKRKSDSPKVGSNNTFGKMLAVEPEKEIFREINWNRIFEETSFTNESQCKLELELQCYLANDRHVSCTSI